jgi:hypothetical protein
MLRRLLLLLALGLFARTAWAQTPPAETAPKPPPGQTVVGRFNGLFNFDLPKLDPPGTVKVIFYPHFGDLVNSGYIRVDGGFRWALNDQFEFSAAAATFFTHGLKDESYGYGVGGVHLGSKYLFREWLRPEFESSVGLNIDLPTGRPPLDMTDGYNHFTPSFIIQQHSPRRPKLTPFASTSLNFLTRSTVPGTVDLRKPQDDSVSLSLGGVYDAGQLKWTLSGTYTTTALISPHATHFYNLNPSVLWYVPRKLTFNSKTQWIVGFGMPMTWSPAGFDLNLRAKLRAEVTFRQVMEKMKLVSVPK